MTSFQDLGTDMSELLSDSFSTSIYFLEKDEDYFFFCSGFSEQSQTLKKNFFSGSPVLVIQEESHMKN